MAAQQVPSQQQLPSGPRLKPACTVCHCGQTATEDAANKKQTKQENKQTTKTEFFGTLQRLRQDTVTVPLWRIAFCYGSSTFLDVVNYIASKKPRAFILENVRFTPYAGINEKGEGKFFSCMPPLT